MANEILTIAKAYIAAANLPSGAIAAEDMLPAATQTQAVNGALATYSRIYPRDLSVAVAGPDDDLLDLSTLTGWEEGISNLIEVEYPYTAATIDENTLHRDAWKVVDDPSNGSTLIFLEDTPASSALVRYRFTGTHEDGDPGSTVRSTHVDAVGKLGAANMALALTSRTAAHKEITVGASISPSQTQAAYRECHRVLRKAFFDDLGIGSDADGGGGEVEAGTSVQAIDRTDYASHGYGYLTHRRRRR
jgi:hypothetical protein